MERVTYILQTSSISSFCPAPSTLPLFTLNKPISPLMSTLSINPKQLFDTFHFLLKPEVQSPITDLSAKDMGNNFKVKIEFWHFISLLPNSINGLTSDTSSVIGTLGLVLPNQLSLYYFSSWSLTFWFLHSTETVLTKVSDDLRKAKCNGSYSLLILLDLSEFDTVDHQLLFSMLHFVILKDTALSWSLSYLSDHTFRLNSHVVQMMCILPADLQRIIVACE